MTPDQLYHYTSFNGLHGIASTRSLWATSVHFLNDSQEFRYGHELFRQRLLHVAASDRLLTGSTLERIAEHLSRWTEPHVFVFSFSEVNDQLSQWRGYCPGGAGVSVGFPVETLRMLASSSQFELTPCVYDQRTQFEMVDEAIIAAQTQIRDTPVQQLEALITAYAVRAITLSPRLKHASFAEEREWRLISPPLMSDDKRIRTRATPALLIPYYDFPLCESNETLQLGDIVIGPNRHPELARSGAWQLLTNGYLKCRSMRNSFIPYREL